jgi:hypothetical protein
VSTGGKRRNRFARLEQPKNPATRAGCLPE